MFLSKFPIAVQHPRWTGSVREVCPACGRIEVLEWSGLPDGVKFDPSDQEVIEHLAATRSEPPTTHPLLNGFIFPAPQQDINSLHPRELLYRNTGEDQALFFNVPKRAHASGTPVKRKLLVDPAEVPTGDAAPGGGASWRRTGNTKVINDSQGNQIGWKQILVLNANIKGQKPASLPWAMHEYHLGTDVKETGQMVVSKILCHDKSIKKLHDYKNLPTLGDVRSILNPSEQLQVHFKSAKLQEEANPYYAGSGLNSQLDDPTLWALHLDNVQASAQQPAGPSTCAQQPAGPSTSAQQPAGPSTSAQQPAGPSTSAQQPQVTYTAQVPFNGPTLNQADPSTNVQLIQDYQDGVNWVADWPEVPSNRPTLADPSTNIQDYQDGLPSLQQHKEWGENWGDVCLDSFRTPDEACIGLPSYHKLDEDIPEDWN